MDTSARDETFKLYQQLMAKCPDEEQKQLLLALIRCLAVQNPSAPPERQPRVHRRKPRPFTGAVG
ncbi:hypothetical protein [Rhodopseudomonas palustris]|uniref:hypothetical protein n=1 Tax=Rhodopseudomonas palustris TaxID=1076 RepID=UPI0002D3C4E4